MSDRIHVLAQQLFGKASVEECDLQEVKALAVRYPYFAPAQFLLLEKLKQEGSTEYAGQLRKAVLYYHNPLEFEYFISSDKFFTEEVDAEMEAEAPPSLHEIKEEGAPDREGQPVNEPASRVADDEPLSFEPYHTVDYFASQGIRLSQEEIPKDKFGQQLKSFTEWLKTMKRLPPKQTTDEIEPATEVKVQHLAEDSIHGNDVFTEAMAEVWLKQGNREKAVAVYNKLSLLNPSKMAYFAAKIENLKRS